jgi:hypothetical protein
MRIRSHAAIFAVLLTQGLWAQAQTSGVSIESKLDTPQARVYFATLKPHVPVPARTGHATDRALIYLDDGVMTMQDGNAKPETIEFHRGDFRWRAASGAYTAENISDHPIRILEIDLKSKASGPAPVSKLDPTVVEAVRVLRVHYDAHDQGKEHEHILNRVVLYLNDQTGAKADDVRMNGAGTHTEQNTGDHPADRIAVEIK